MDPDRWEFANEWFLRGQKQLLVNIVRKKQSKISSNSVYYQGKQEELMDEEVIVMEIARLKEQQKALEKELEGMNKRLEATERRPHQMMAFLCKVAEDPDLVSRILVERERRQLGEKKRRLLSSAATTTTSSSSSSGMPVKTEVEEDEATVGGMITSSPETGFEFDHFCRSSPPQETIIRPNTVSDWWGQREAYVGQPGNSGAAVPTPLTAVPVWRPLGGSYSGSQNREDGQMRYFMEMATESNPPPPYPFSLLEGGF